MISDSPHLYLAAGLRRGVSLDVLNAALMQAGAVEDAALASVLTLNHLAYQTQTPYNFLRAVVERRRDPYRELTIARRNGRKMRAISIPEPVLMNVHRWVLRRILAKIPTRPASYAYAPGQSIKDCAVRHLGADWIIKLDIRSFFESIAEDRVVKVFQNAGYQPLPALELARICTRYADHAAHIDQERFRSSGRSYRAIPAYACRYRGFVPQGAPTSGALSNLVCAAMDRDLSSLASELGVVYTRYADDMTFSAPSTVIDREKAGRLISRVAGVVRQQRFPLH